MLLYGLGTGILFGFLLQKARVIRYDKQISALLLKDMTIVKFMLSAITVGMIGVYLLKDLGMVSLSIKPAILGGIILGGLFFGAGWGLIGYCPGTAVGALGEGRVDAFWGILGMIFGAGLFAEVYPWMTKTVLTWENYGKITLPDILKINHWFIIAIFVVLASSLCLWFEKKETLDRLDCTN